jgi:hypothetical protein
MSAASPTATGSAAYGHRLHPRQDFSDLMGCVLRCRRLRRRGADGTRGHSGRRHPADPLRAQAGADRSGAAQGDHGDLVRSVLRHAVAGDWPALRHSVQHALHPVRPVDSAQSVAPPAQPLDPGLAAGLRRYSGTQRRHHRQCRSAPTCFGRGFDGGKKIKGIKIHLAVDKYGFPLAINVSAANMHDSKGIVPVLHQLAGRGFKGTALGDLSYRGQRLTQGEAQRRRHRQQAKPSRAVSALASVSLISLRLDQRADRGAVALDQVALPMSGHPPPPLGVRG